MLFKSAIISTFALCMATAAVGAAVESPVHDIEARIALTATDPCTYLKKP